MIKHIVFWKMPDFAEGNDKSTNIDIAMAELDRIWPEYTPLKKCNWHKGIRSGGKNWDLVLEMEFDDMEGMNGWAAFPKHEKLHEFAEKVRIDRAVIDYEF
jgi:hypothetical protein